MEVYYGSPFLLSLSILHGNVDNAECLFWVGDGRYPGHSSVTDDRPTAWRTGDADGVLSLMDAHYTVFTVPKVDGELDFHGVSVGATPEDFKKGFANPDWKAARVAALADTVLNEESSHELARIDVKGDYAVAVSRIEWARNDTTKTNPNGSYRWVSGGWESVWFLRKIDGNWKFTAAGGGIKSWGEGD